jgi:UPF0176 protein
MNLIRWQICALTVDLQKYQYMQFHVAFYQFVQVDDPHALAVQLRQLTYNLLGSVLVAHEGINGTVAGSANDLHAFEHALTQDARFAHMAFKRTACTTAPFARMKVHVKPEIVLLGVDPVDAIGNRGINVPPQQWRAMLAQDDVVVIDNRNSFEYRLGHFKGAIDPQVASFRDFPKFMQENLPTWQAQGKKIAMYCTGGIRCEKTSAWMKQLGVEIYQLEGGILNYFQTVPNAQQEFEGECFVFDNRIALNTQLQETATTLEDVYAAEPDGAWRIARARRLQQALDPASTLPARDSGPQRRAL